MSKHSGERTQQKALFEFFRELAIIQQLATSAFNQCMPDGLHISHFSAISHLKHMDKGETPIQIANALQVTKATMTHTLNVLQKRGFIEIIANPDDGRSKLVHLTKAGARFQQKAIDTLAPTFSFIGRECDVAELSATLPVLQRLREILDQNRNS